MKSLIAAIVIGILFELALVFSATTPQSSSDITGRIFYGGLFWALWFTPVIVAYVRHRTNIGTIFVVDFFLGFTVIGWIVALAMAAGGTTTKPAATT